MAQTMTKEARRRKVRTYEGVQWFQESLSVWIAAVPGTNMAVQRFKHVDWKNNGLWNVWVVRWTGSDWSCMDVPRDLPWDFRAKANVKTISRDVQVLRAFVDGRSPHGVA